MNNHKTPTNGYLESGQKFPRLYIAAAFLYYYFFIIKAELGLQEIEKTLKLYLAYVTASLAPRVCLAYGYLLFSSVLSKYMGMPVIEVTFTVNQSLTTEKTEGDCFPKDGSYSKHRNPVKHKFCEIHFSRPTAKSESS